MQVIKARNVNDALAKGIILIRNKGEIRNSRVGSTLEIPEPVATVYQNPWERVLINPSRDANPFFHLMEAMWIIAGRQDVKFLTEFNKRMADYSDNGEVFNAPYGYRLKYRWGVRGPLDKNLDQLQTVIDILRKDPNSRQAVCQIWDTNDLEHNTLDKACNMSIVFRVRNDKLDITVYNRSNDMIWGAYGANVVQFSMIQEYVAAHLNIPMGTYTQVSNAFHVYTSGPGGELWERLSDQTDRKVIKELKHTSEMYSCLENIVTMSYPDMSFFEHDLKQFFKIYDDHGLLELGDTTYWESRYFRDLIMPVLSVFLVHKEYGAKVALNHINSIRADDWKKACSDWLTKRIK